ncbi:unnamed protein product [Prorocentrum cordatum]|uniref:DNA (cytosine-5-)-methyltransferase n=1 Tax=Prorocentrum cordatum TaxID=2364126 RepID=A0ABN9RUV2_9DINO|nr:unnamed protein product [Polarella glacialis]
MAARTLDIREAQVLVHYPDEDLSWHHRVLLHRVEGALWLGLTPDHEIARFAPLVHAFDPIDGQTLRDAKRQVEDAEEYVWLLASVTDARFGEAVPADVIEDGDRCVSLGERDSWVQSCREDVEDIRALGGHRARVGRRDLDFRDAVESMREVTVADWPDQGPRACLEYLKSIALGAGNLLTYQAEWQRLSGVAEGGAQGHEHRCHLETLRRAICHDQLNVVNLACFEHIVRRVIQVEMAVEKNPRHPGFSGLEDVLAGPRSVSGSAHVPRRLGQVTNRQKDRAQILKHQRLYQEEATKRRSVKGDGKGETRDGSRAKQKAKVKRGPPSAGADGGGGMTPRSGGACAAGLAEPASGTRRRPGVSELPKKHWWPDGHWLHSDPPPLPYSMRRGGRREQPGLLWPTWFGGVSGYGEPPREATDGEWPLRAILKSADQRELEPRHLASYDPDKLHIASGALRPVPASALPPEAAAGYLRHFESQVGLTAPELEARAIKSRCGVFFAHKKDGRIRFICDARRANLCHRRPPRTVLGGPASLSELDRSPLAEALGGFGGALGLPLDLHASSADVKDCFHQLEVGGIASWFGFDCPLTVEEWGAGISHVYDDDLKGPTPVKAGELLYPATRALPMGWPWALHFAQEAATALAERGCPGGSEQLLQDKRPAPLLRPGRPVSAAYVDNFAGLGGCREGAVRGVRGFERAAADTGLKLHVPEVALTELESLGLVIHGSDKTLRHAPHRVWRFHVGAKELFRRGRCTPAELRAWAGRAVHLFSLQPLLPSILQDTRTFVGNGLGARRLLPRGVRLELRLAAALVFLGGANLAAPYDDEVHVSDSATGGYCLMHGRKPTRAVRGAWRWRGQWRFVEVEAECDDAHYTSAYLAQLRGLPADDELEIPKFADVQLRAGRSTGAWPSTELGQLAFGKVGQARRRQGCGAVGGRHRQEVELLNVAPKLPVALTRDEGWRRAAAGRWQRPEGRINIKEARACVMGLRRSCRDPRHHGRRALSLRDNMATRCCLDKGRSTSRALNTQCRRAAGYALGCGIRGRVRHIPTDLCAADYGSRPREPPEPKWLRAAKARRQVVAPWEPAPGLRALRAETALERSAGGRSASAEARHAREPESAKVFLELFSGTGGLSRALVSAGLRVGFSFDIRKGAQKLAALLTNASTLASLAADWAACLTKAAPAMAFGASPPFVGAWAGELEALVPRRRRGAAEGDARPADTAAGGSASCARADRYLAEHGVLFGNTSAVERAALQARGRSRADYLKLKGVSEATLALYRKGVDEFESWCRLNGRQNNNLANVDANLVGWMTELYFAGLGPASGRNGLFGYLLPRGDNRESGVGQARLPRARRQLKGWCKSDPGAVGMPYPLSVRWQLAEAFLADGEPRLAALVVIQTDCYLRPSDALAFGPEDALVGCADAGAEYAGKVVLHLAPGDRGRPTKTGIFDDAVEVGVAGRGWAKALEAPLEFPELRGLRIDPAASLTFEVSVAERVTVDREARRQSRPAVASEQLGPPAAEGAQAAAQREISAIGGPSNVWKESGSTGSDTTHY